MSYTGMRAAKPADYEKAAEMIDPGGWHTFDVGLAKEKPLKSVGWTDAFMGFANRVRFAQVLAGRTVYNAEAIGMDAGVGLPDPKGTPAREGEFANLKRYHRYGLPFIFEKRYKELRLL